MQPQSDAQKRARTLGHFRQAPNGQVMGGWHNYFMMEDASDKVSPMTVTTEEVVELKVPNGAVQILISCSEDIRVGDQADLSKPPYFIIGTSDSFTFPCVAPSSSPNDLSGTIYLLADSHDAIVQFMFFNL